MEWSIMPFSLSGNILENNTVFFIRLPGFWGLLCWVVIFQRDHMLHWLPTSGLDDCQHDQYTYFYLLILHQIFLNCLLFLVFLSIVILAFPCLMII